MELLGCTGVPKRRDNCRYYAGSLAASGNVYRVVRERGKWKVKEDKMIWIS